MKNRKHPSKKKITGKRAGFEAQKFEAGSFADFCIIGAGAAGLVAGISYLRENPGAKVYILEKNEKAGRKIFATGNGRCNLSNTACTNHEAIRDFFESIGVWTKTDEAGRIYPQSEAAADVVHALLLELARLGAHVLCSCEVTGLFKKDGNEENRDFIVEVNGHETLYAKSVLLATGGKAGPQFGCTGDGYRFAKDFGLAVTRVYPALSGIELAEAETDRFALLRGTRLKGKVSLVLKDEIIAESEGEIQCNEYGVSGICIMDLSSRVRLSKEISFADYKLIIAPEVGEAVANKEVCLAERAKLPGLSADDLLLSLLPDKAAKYLLSKAGIEPGKPAADITEKLGLLEDLLTGSWQETVSGVRGWKQAQCTGGGIELSQTDDRMAVKSVPGLFAAGEVLDYVGPCGGFNLNYAWSTGLLAGKAAADVSNSSD